VLVKKWAVWVTNHMTIPFAELVDIINKKAEAQKRSNKNRYGQNKKYRKQSRELHPTR